MSENTDPEWLLKEYLEYKLCRYFEDDSLQLKKIETQPATAKGDNYASVMTRINLKYTTKDSKDTQSATFLLKTTFASKDPAANILAGYGLEDSRKMFAATVDVDRERDSILFEDLTLEDYKVACRLKKLDLEHTHLVLEKLAEFHAAAAVLAERKPGIFEKNYDRGFFNKHFRGFQPIFRNLLQALSRSLELNLDLKHRYQRKIDRLVDTIMDYGDRSTSISPGDFLTLAHGDLWTTNVMFQYDEQGHPINAVLIDFQFSVWNSPAIDLHYFFSTSIQDHLRWKHQPELVQFYYYRLVESLKKLQYSRRIPSLFEFQLQFRARSFYSVFCSLISEPCMLYTGTEEASIAQGLSTAASGVRFRDSVYHADHIREKMVLTLPFLDQQGLLDDM
ncbi:GD21198 [Drosophila simulans]|uniref:GD21198 n=1 Tax=Drosophila simulans TaxID=7240 RepID=B4QUS3_DROSI|nr:GD21198 [Drosophila simulans]